MSESLRDERVSVYSYASVNDEGYARSTFTLTGTYWGRKASPGTREATIAGQASQRVDAVFVLPERATIDDDGAIKGQDGVMMKITGVQPVRNTASIVEQIITAVYSDEQNLGVPALASITVAPATVSKAPAETQQLTATGLDQFGASIAAGTITWASDDTDVATVNSAGLVTAVAEGTANITATRGSVTGTSVVTVTP